MKLSQWAKKHSLCYHTAYQHFRKGIIPGAFQLPTGTIIVPEPVNNERPDYTIVYGRVSSSQNKANLETQVDRISQYCAARGWTINEIIKEIGSGLNDKRSKLCKLLVNPSVTRIVVEHKDRLTRFGFEYIKLLFKGELVVINEATTDKQDLMQDFVSLVTSFCARIYGKRRSKRKTEKIIKELQDNA